MKLGLSQFSRVFRIKNVRIISSSSTTTMHYNIPQINSIGAVLGNNIFRPRILIHVKYIRFYRYARVERVIYVCIIPLLWLNNALSNTREFVTYLRRGV